MKTMAEPRFGVALTARHRPQTDLWRTAEDGGSTGEREAMTSLDVVMRNQPYPCFKLISLPESLQHQLKKGMLCLYNIENRTFDFPIVGQIGPAEELFAYLEFVGYHSVEEFRDLVFSGRLPVTCPSCKGPVTDAGMISFEVEEAGTTEAEFANGDGELYICDLCGRPFALMPVE
jgi:hypothetical protein